MKISMSDFQILQVSQTKLLEQKTDALLAFVTEESFKKTLKEITGKHYESILKVCDIEEFTGKFSKVIDILSFDKFKAKRIILVGLGKKEEIFCLNKFRKCVAAGVRRAASLKSKILSVQFPELEQASGKSDKKTKKENEENEFKAEEFARAIAEVSLLAPYSFKEFKSKDKKNNGSDYDGIQKIELLVSDTKLKVRFADAIKLAIAGAEGVLLARDLIVRPSNEITPERLAKVSEEIAKNAKKDGLTLKVMGRKECEKLGMNAFLAVGRGSQKEPKFIHFHYVPSILNKKSGAKKAKKRHIAFVGKGITFDSGGLSLKPANSMEGMKHDMSGSAAVIGLMKAVAKLKPNVEITAIVAACENMPDGDSYRPGDVIKSMSGKTIEILNTDAEGRVTLADSVYYACKQKPDIVIDIATLTGAVVVALGETAAGIMTNNQEALDKVKEAFDSAGERVWQLPLFEEYEDCIKRNTIADMVNTGSKGQAGSQNGGSFIKQFVGDTPWVHIDIAGSCWPELHDTWYTPKGNPAGFGVLGFLRYIENAC